MLHYQTIKLYYFTNTKDKTAFLSQSLVIYKFVCPGCKSYYVRKTDRTLHERTKEHAYVKDDKNEQSPIFEHLPSWTHYSHIADLLKIDTNSFNSNQFNVSQIKDNIIILDKGNNWNVLLFKKALIIKKQRPSLNCGLMAFKELQLFWLHLMTLFDILFALSISNYLDKNYSNFQTTCFNHTMIFFKLID